MPRRPPSIRHCTSQPLRFFGRLAELALLDRALAGGEPSVAAFIGPGGQGKTAIVQHWLERAATRLDQVDGVFLWSFYRGKDSDLCLRELLAYAEGLTAPPDVSASYCVDRLIPRLRQERWALVFDGAEVVQHETGSWFGRFVHPELGRLLEELAAAPLPGVVVVTTRFPLPTLTTRRHAQLLVLNTLDTASGAALLASLGVQGSQADLEDAARSCGLHAKAVELLGTWLVRYHGGDAARQHDLPPIADAEASDEERHVARVLAAFHRTLSDEQKDILALATAFRQPPTEARFIDYLVSEPTRHLLHDVWRRSYPPFATCERGWPEAQIEELASLRLLERVGLALRGGIKTASGECPPSPPGTPGGEGRGEGGQHPSHYHECSAGSDPLTPDPSPPEYRGRGEAGATTVLEGGPSERADVVLDAHPLVRRGFEGVLGAGEHGAQARAGFLRGRPDRRPPKTLQDAREEVELFHAFCDADLWNEADGTLMALDNPKHRFLAPAFERELLLRFFPRGDWRQPPLWHGFGRWRSLAICHELLGQFEEALELYRAADAALRGDALIALGRLQPLLDQPQAAHPWQSLWQAYRAHALCLAGRTEEALAVAHATIAIDVYEWMHLFECWLRLGRLDAIDLASLLYRQPMAHEHAWADLARRRMRADYLRVMRTDQYLDLDGEYRSLLDQYDRAGLPVERVLTSCGYGRLLLDLKRPREALAQGDQAAALGQRFHMSIFEVDAWELQAAALEACGDNGDAQTRLADVRAQLGTSQQAHPGRP